MAEIIEGMSESKKKKAAAADVFSSGVFQPSSFPNVLQNKNVTGDSDVKYKDKVMEEFSECESSLEVLAKEHTSKGTSVHGHNPGQSKISMELDRFQGTSGKVCTYGDERIHMLEPHSKRFKLLSSFSQDGECSSHNKGCMALQSEDEYEHVTSGLVYITTSYPGSGVPQDIYDDHIQGCECNGQCSDDCICTLQYGCPYENGKLKENHYKKPIFECNEWCNCNDDCPNRVVQLGPVTGLKVLSVQDKGYGVVSSYFIPKNSFICEYAGEYIGVKEAYVRFSQQSDKGSNYILVLREHVQGSASDPQITIIDPTVVGNIGRYMNHSCDPNLMVVPVRINSMLPLAALFSIRDIFPGEELCYDYSNLIMQDDTEELSASFKTNTGGPSEEHECDNLINKSLCEDNTNICFVDESSVTHWKSNKTEGCEMLNVLSCDESPVEGDEPKGDSSSHLQKPCHCNAKNCRLFLPLDKDII